MKDMADGQDGASPEIAALDALATRYETPCGDGVMVWRAWGRGEPLLLLHGAHGGWTHWIRNIEALSADRCLLVPDLPGYGESAVPPSTEEGASYAEAIATGLEILVGDAAPIDVIGFSLGGVLAGTMAANHPHLVRYLILVDAGGLDTPHGDIRSTPVRKLTGEAAREAHRFNLLGLMLKHEDSVDELALDIQTMNIPRARVTPNNLVGPDRLLQVLPRIGCPIDLIWGEFDTPHPYPEMQLEVIARTHPRATMTVLEGAGHWAMYERADAFNVAARRLLGM